jgi:hypothetical protein
MSGLILDNFVAWSVQVLVIGSVGALLPIAFRIRYPRSHLFYCHTLRAVCLVLPILQPWHEPLVASTAITVEELTVSEELPALSPAPASLSWGPVFLWLLVIGALTRFCWLVAGCWRISRYRRSATPLHSVPASASAARKLTGSDDLLCVSSDITGR